MTAVPPQSRVTEGVRSLEYAGSSQASWRRGWPDGSAVPGREESREDAYLLDPQLRGLSVKIRGGVALEVKAYCGSPGILEVPDRARGRMESWQKWSFPFSPLRPGSGGPPGWRTVRKRRRISRFPLASGQIVARAQGLVQQPRCEVELTEVYTSGQHWVDLVLQGPAPGAAAHSGPPPRSCSPRLCPVAWNPARMTPFPTRSG